MEKCHTLIIGAGVSGLSFANFTDRDDYLILEGLHEIGGYCRTVKQDGFVWDFSGHFFHFRHPEIEKYLVDRMDDEVSTVVKSSKIKFKDRMVEFPFQKNIHQLPQEDFIECLYELFFREEKEATNFEEMLYAKFGKGITDRFLVPYNEKLYACPLSELDADAMGRFFPHANLEEIIRNFKAADNASYNATFTYPRGGAIQYINALASEVPDDKIRLNTWVDSLDLDRKVAQTSAGEIAFEQVVSSAPLDRLLKMANVPFDREHFSYNKVLVFNLGFDRKAWDCVHWVYFPERKYRFYRVGFYDNIFGTDRASLYIEIGMKAGDVADVNSELARVLADLELAGVTDGHKLVSKHSVVLDPAYVHVAGPSQIAVAEHMKSLANAGVYSIGRYGGWKYCAIEDNIVEARDLAERLG